ncbi:enoyl-CoA hydratase/isomerase family protein [uncultured Roseobacter sp.]|uniref:enoyl-CoA hydratase/isomerase family protein n=1 Tax=uncultured Roseobacter sp. TaxID=114847 RepID=UPI00260F9C06|nr:enoyl-CoA hydratase/isomerase family protein [uncultured Roseobacter sp.]
MSDVQLHIDGDVAVLTLQNPDKLNALTTPMLEALDAHLTQIERDTTLRCVILTGTGRRAFCCGADIAAWGHLSPGAFARHWVRDGHRIFDRLARLSMPTIAALNGHAFGGGLELASACDIRVMVPGATLALPEARVGIVQGWSGTQRVLRLFPEPVVKEMVLFGRRIPAERAMALGYVAEIADDALASAQEIAASLGALSPRAVEVSKYMLHAATGEDRAAMVEALGSAAIAASDDRVEGVTAFLDKRPPKFSGQ